MIPALWIALCVGLSPASAQEPEAAQAGETAQAAQPTRVTASLTVAVTQWEAAADTLVEAAQTHGGWFQSRTRSSLSLRVPTEHVDALVALSEEQGKVIERTVTREDVGQQIAEISGRLKAREEVLERYYDVLKTASSSSIVAVERQVVHAIEQIEGLKGQLRLLEDQARYGRVEIAFQFRDRAAPVRDGSSSFPWLNTLNVQDVISGHRQRHPHWRAKGMSLTEPPSGFSAWRRERRYRAASPDGVLFRMRTERHKPRGTLSFWKEAVRERMEAAGYRILAESELEASGHEGGLIELAAPLGTEDWSYLIAFFPRGRKIAIVEAAGEVTTSEAHREAILASLDTLSL